MQRSTFFKRCAPTRFQPAILLILLIAGLLVATGGCTQTADAPPKRQIGTVLLVVDFGPELKTSGTSGTIEAQIPCSEDSTAFDILRRAELCGDLKMKSSGSGETAFIKSINDVGPQTATQTAKDSYWICRLNGDLISASCGVTEVDPGDTLKWSFGAAPPELLPQE